MLRSHLPPHQAVFRVPTHLNKIDIKSYLTQLYGIKILDMRTSIVPGQWQRTAIGNKRSPDWKKVGCSVWRDLLTSFPLC
jgi:ribosomal protein L23